MTFTLAMRAELDPAGVKSGAAEVKREVGSLRDEIDRQLVSSPVAGRAADVDAYGKELDDLRARFNPVFAAQQRYERELSEINRAHKVGAISADEMTAAVARSKAAYASQATAAQLAAVNAQNAGLRSAASAQLATHEVTNLSYQMNDIATMLASGQSPFLIMAQQGMQVSQIMGRRGLGQILPALRTGLASLITPTTLFLAAATAGGYAASAVFAALRGDVADVETLVGEHAETVEELGRAWGRSGRDVEAYGQTARRELELIASVQREALRARIVPETRNALEALGTITPGEDFGDGLVQDSFSIARRFRDFAAPIRQLYSEFERGNPDVAEFRSEITRIAAANPELAETAVEVLSITDAVSELAEATDTAAGAFDRMLDGSERVMDALRKLDEFARPDLTSRQEIERIYDEAIGRAQTSGQIEALNAARQAALAALAAEKAEEEFLQRFAGSIPQDRPNPEAIDPREVPAARLIASQQEQLAQTRLEIELIGRSAQVRAEATALLEAELRIREMAIGAQSAEANTIRDNARALAEVRLELERQSDAWSTVEDSASRTIDTIVDKLTAGDIEGALEALARNTASMLNELAIANPIKNALLGQNNPTLSDLGGIGGIIGRLLGRGDGTSPADMVSLALGQSVGAMNVSAATVIVNGSVVGGAAGDVARLLNPASGNRTGNSFLDLLGRAEGTDRGRGYDESLGYGAFTGGPRDLTSMTLDQIDALQGRMLAHPDNHFNSSALGRYQIVRRTLRGLRGEMGLSGDELFDPSMQDRLATHLMGRRGNSVAGLRNEWEGLRNVDAGEITAAFEKSTRAVTGFAGQIDQSIGGLANLTQGFEHLGSGFSDLARQLAGAGAPGGGSLLQDLFGGVGGLARSWSISPAATAFIAGGGVGLFGEGGWTGPGGKYDPKGIVHADEFVFSAEATRSIGVANLESLHRAAKHGFADGGFVGTGPAVATQLGGANIVNIHNYSSARITETETEDGRGGRRTELVIEDQIGGMISRTGSAPQRAMRQTFGLRNAVARR